MGRLRHGEPPDRKDAIHRKTVHIDGPIHCNRYLFVHGDDQGSVHRYADGECGDVRLVARSAVRARSRCKLRADPGERDLRVFASPHQS